MSFQKKNMEELQRATLESFQQQEKWPLVLILDEVRSGLNVGSAFRTADSFALQALALCGITVQPPHREILKTALGATESVAWSYFSDTLSALNHYREQGFRILGVEQAQDSISLEHWQVEAQQPIALVFGNEVEGVSQAVLDQCDGCLEIPQFGTKHSLNIAVSLGILCWEYCRQQLHHRVNL